jgi:hypothetical protein
VKLEHCRRLRVACYWYLFVGGRARSVFGYTRFFCSYSSSMLTCTAVNMSDITLISHCRHVCKFCLQHSLPVHVHGLFSCQKTRITITVVLILNTSINAPHFTCPSLVIHLLSPKPGFWRHVVLFWYVTDNVCICINSVRDPLDINFFWPFSVFWNFRSFCVFRHCFATYRHFC